MIAQTHSAPASPALASARLVSINVDTGAAAQRPAALRLYPFVCAGQRPVAMPTSAHFERLFERSAPAACRRDASRGQRPRLTLAPQRSHRRPPTPDGPSDPAARGEPAPRSAPALLSSYSCATLVITARGPRVLRVRWARDSGGRSGDSAAACSSPAYATTCRGRSDAV